MPIQHRPHERLSGSPAPSPLRSIVRGFGAGRRVVIAAAIIMICVFGGFIFSDSVFIVALGLGWHLACCSTPSSCGCC
jgi:uncharacterized membrane protein YdfJ with MMPL/SSD domain